MVSINQRWQTWATIGSCYYRREAQQRIPDDAPLGVQRVRDLLVVATSIASTCNFVVVAPVVVAALKDVVMDGVHEVEEHIDDISNREDNNSHHQVSEARGL